MLISINILNWSTDYFHRIFSFLNSLNSLSFIERNWVMIGDDSDSNIDVDSGAHIGSPEFRFKIMSYSGEQIRIHLWSRGMQSVFNLIADNYQAEEVKELTDSEFIDIKSITDGLSEVKILSKFYDCLGLDSSKLLGIQYPPGNSSIRSVCSEKGSSNTELIKKSLLKHNKNEKLSDN